MRELSFNAFLQLMPLWSLSLFSFIPLILKTANNNKEPHPQVVLGIHFFGIFTSLGLFFLLGFQEEHPIVFSLHFDVFESALVFWQLCLLFNVSLFLAAAPGWIKIS